MLQRAPLNYRAFGLGLPNRSAESLLACSKSWCGRVSVESPKPLAYMYVSTTLSYTRFSVQEFNCLDNGFDILSVTLMVC